MRSLCVNGARFYLLGRGCGRDRRHTGLLARYVCLLRRVEVLAQVDEAGLVLNELEDLNLPVHHVFVLENLLHGDNLTRLLDFCLPRKDAKQSIRLKSSLADTLDTTTCGPGVRGALRQARCLP